MSRRPLSELFHDLERVPQDDGPHPVVAINYSQEFRETMDYFRAVLKVSEVSDRALELTERVIDLNPANYTAWQYRRQCLKKLHKDMRQELQYVSNVAMQSPKNYQLWWHRRCIIEDLRDPREEKNLVRQLLRDDAKNYHVWSHLHWVLKSFDLWEGELEYVNQLLKEDIRNNSAWNHRHFVIESTETFNNPEVLEREISYAQEKIRILAYNDSAWYYLTGLVNKKNFTDWDSLMRWVEDLLRREPNCARAHLFYIDMCRMSGQKNHLERAMRTCDQLADNIDRIRYKYYQFLKKQIEMDLNALNENGVRRGRNQRRDDPNFGVYDDFLD